MKSNQKDFVHLVGSYTYCRMMHGSYSVERMFNIKIEYSKTSGSTKCLQLVFLFVLRKSCDSFSDWSSARVIVFCRPMSRSLLHSQTKPILQSKINVVVYFRFKQCFHIDIFKIKPETSLFQDVTQRRLLISYRRFGTIYRSILQGTYTT